MMIFTNIVKIGMQIGNRFQVVPGLENNYFPYKGWFLLILPKKLTENCVVLKKPDSKTLFEPVDTSSSLIDHILSARLDRQWLLAFN